MDAKNSKEIVEKILDKIPTDKIYEDLLQPGLKKAGIALETVIDVSNTILLPLKLLNERSRIYFNANIKRYEKKLESVQDEKLCQVPEYVGLPILEKLTYLNQEDLSEAFINLLTKASSTDTLNLVHPGFIQTLNSLSADEAKILFHYKNADAIPFIDIYVEKYKETVNDPNFPPGPKTREQLKKLVEFAFQDRESLKLKADTNKTGIETLGFLDFPENIYIYVENLERLGLIEFERNVYNSNHLHTYDKLENEVYKARIDEISDWLKEPLDCEYKAKLLVERGCIEFTDYGSGFIKACIKEINEEAKL
jgi:hypothetical protein